MSSAGPTRRKGRRRRGDSRRQRTPHDQQEVRHLLLPPVGLFYQGLVPAVCAQVNYGALWKVGRKKSRARAALKWLYREASNRVGKSHSRPSLDGTINAPKG